MLPDPASDYHVFISTKSEDIALARQVYAYLEGHGLRAFLSDISISEMGAADYQGAIDDALEGSPHLILVASRPEHVASPWVRSEWSAFLNELRSGRKKGNIVTVLADPIRVEDLPISLRTFQSFHIDQDGLQGLERYVSADTTPPLERKTEDASPEPRATRHLAGPWPEQDRFTKRLEDVPDMADAPKPMAVPGDLAAGRWRIESEPVGKETGEAQVFIGRDTRNGEQVAVKIYRESMTPKASVMRQLLNLDHPNLVGLRDYGNWSGHFFEVLEYCRGGSMAELMPLDEDQLRSYLRQIVSGLSFCHSQGIVHRDVKPTNILFRDEARTDAAIADFGISSRLDEGEQGKKTRTFMFFTLDYCSPEQLRLREVGPASDYYSLGITLSELLTGRSPLEGLSEHAMVDLHLSGGVPLPKELSDDMRRLIRGLLRNNPENRWGRDQIRAWLKREPIVDELGRPDRDEVFFGREIPYPECTEAGNPRELAGRLDSFDAEQELFRGRISLWVKLFDPVLSERITRVEEWFGQEPDLGLFMLRHLLDPDLGYEVHGRCLRSREDLSNLLESRDQEVRASIRQEFWSGRMECWLAAVTPPPQGDELFTRIREFRERHQGRPEQGLAALRWLLHPQAPLVLGTGARVETPEDLAQAMAAAPGDKGLWEEAGVALFSGRLSAWLELAFPQREEDQAFVARCMAEFPSQRTLGLHALVWRFKQDFSFPFGELRAQGPKDLAAMIRADEESWERGCSLLVRRWLTTWLTAAGYVKNSAPLARITDNSGLSPSVRLDMLTALMDPDLPRPKLFCEDKALDLGIVSKGDRASMEIQFENRGQGHLFGSLGFDKRSYEFHVSPDWIEGPLTVARVTITPPEYLAPGLVVTATLAARTNGGQMDIPVKYRVGARLVLIDEAPSALSQMGASLKGFFSRKK